MFSNRKIGFLRKYNFFSRGGAAVAALMFVPAVASAALPASAPLEDNSINFLSYGLIKICGHHTPLFIFKPIAVSFVKRYLCAFTRAETYDIDLYAVAMSQQGRAYRVCRRSLYAASAHTGFYVGKTVSQ